MMHKLFITILSCFLSVSIGAASEIGGVQIPDTMKAGDETLVLNGGGVRNKYFMDLYVGGLYLKEKNHDPRKIIDAEEPMAIRLEIISGLITGEKMSKSTEEGFEASTGGKTAPIKDEIEAFISVFKEGIKKGDVYELVYIPGRGVGSYKNGRLVTTVAGFDFKKALFGIWLCEKPTINASLKKGMLGE